MEVLHRQLLPELSSLTSGIVNLTNLLTAKQPSMSGEISHASVLKRKRSGDHECPPTKKQASQADSAMTNSHDEGLLNQLLNFDALLEKSADFEQEPEDELLSQLKEYEPGDSVGDNIANVQLAKLVTKMSRSRMADKTTVKL